MARYKLAEWVNVGDVNADVHGGMFIKIEDVPDEILNRTVASLKKEDNYGDTGWDDFLQGHIEIIRTTNLREATGDEETFKEGDQLIDVAWMEFKDVILPGGALTDEGKNYSNISNVTTIQEYFERLTNRKMKDVDDLLYALIRLGEEAIFYGIGDPHGYGDGVFDAGLEDEYWAFMEQEFGIEK